MRKSSLFTSDDLDGMKTAADAGMEAPPKKSRYAPLKDGTRAIARIIFAKDASGAPVIRESKGAKWIDARFVLEGRYNNRWIPHRFMLSGSSEATQNLVRKTADFRSCIFSCHAIDPKSPLSKAEGIRIPVMIGIEKRHGDNKTQNFIRYVMSANPQHPTYFEYEAFAKTKTVKLHPNAETGKKRRWIDFPGWNLYPFTQLAETLQKRINNYNDRADKNTNRAIERMRSVKTSKQVEMIGEAK